MTNRKPKTKDIEYLYCPKCGRCLTNSSTIYLDLGRIVMCEDCVDFDEFYDCRMKVHEWVEQNPLYLNRN